MNFITLSLGCKVNSYEISAISEKLISEGYKEVKEGDVDVCLINTCSVTSVADQKSRQHIRKLRKAYPKAILVVMGCYSQHESELVASFGADIVLGTSNRNKIIDYINDFIKTKKAIIDVDSHSRKFNYEELGTLTILPSTRAYVKIQDGCNNFCSYCIIPQTRGVSRSRNKDNIIKEIKELVKNGFKEIVLTGIHVAGYGQDLGDYSFSNLISDIIKEVPSLYRLRISSIEESEIDDELINLLKSGKTIANHLHIPLQSGSKSVLQRMHRKYDTEAFFEKIKKIRDASPDISITTDVIVGFPGETQEEFLETVNFIKKIKFSELHVFPFSIRENTLASRMDNQVSPETKKERVKTLLELGKTLQNEYESKFVNKPLEVLFEEYDKNKKINKGHASNYIEVQVNSDISFHNQIKTVIYRRQ